MFAFVGYMCLTCWKCMTLSWYCCDVPSRLFYKNTFQKCMIFCFNLYVGVAQCSERVIWLFVNDRVSNPGVDTISWPWGRCWWWRDGCALYASLGVAIVTSPTSELSSRVIPLPKNRVLPVFLCWPSRFALSFVDEEVCAPCSKPLHCTVHLIPETWLPAPI